MLLGLRKITAIELSSTGDRVVTNMGKNIFNTLFAANPIVQYTRNEIVHSVYKRTSKIPDGFDAYSIFTHTWRDKDNILNTDFEIYNSLEDMKANRNRWTFCNYNDPGVGYPRDCGQNGFVGHTFFTMPGSGVNHLVVYTKGASFQLFERE